MKRKTNPNPILEMLLHSAKGFYDVGFNCAYNVSKDKGITGYQRLAAGAVNLIFAAELFLKGLHLVFHSKPVKGHYIKSLFSTLPKNIQEKVEKRYDFHRKAEQENKELSAFVIRVSKVHKDERSVAGYPEKESLLDFLDAHDKGFENLRYLYEIGDEGYHYDVNYKLLDCFIKATIDVINEVQVQKQLVLHKVGNRK